jgi:hypothetical protein
MSDAAAVRGDSDLGDSSIPLLPTTWHTRKLDKPAHAARRAHIERDQHVNAATLDLATLVKAWLRDIVVAEARRMMLSSFG